MGVAVGPLELKGRARKWPLNESVSNPSSRHRVCVAKGVRQVKGEGVWAGRAPYIKALFGLTPDMGGDNFSCLEANYVWVH